MSKVEVKGIDYKQLNAVLSKCDLVPSDGIFSDDVHDVIKREAYVKIKYSDFTIEKSNNLNYFYFIKPRSWSVR
jgi:hypothetical protein